MEDKKTEVLEQVEPVENKTGEMPVVEVAEEEKNPKNKKPIIIAIVVVAAILIGVGIAFALNNSASTQPDNSETNAVVDEEDVDFTLNADGWTEDSSAFIVHVEGKDSSDNEVDFYHAFNKSDDMKLDLSDGKYHVSFISAINNDGSIYKTDNTTDLEVKKGIGKVDQTFEKVDADKVSADDLNNLLDKINEAISKGDDSLTGDKGKQEVEKAADNAANNNNADKSKVEEKKSEAASKAESTQPTTTKPAQSNNNNSQNTGSTPQQPAQSNNSGNNSGGNTGGSQQPAAHEHSWTPITQTVHHDAVYQTQTINHPGEYATVCLTCWYNGITVVNPSYDHLLDHIMNGGTDAYGEKCISNPWTETKQVLVSEAYDENIVTGYQCSSCGATK